MNQILYVFVLFFAASTYSSAFTARFEVGEGTKSVMNLEEGTAFLSACTPVLVESLVAECLPKKGFTGSAGSAIGGAVIKIYNYQGTLVPPNAGSNYLAGTITANANGSWVWKCNGNNNCPSGANNCISPGTYLITQTAGAACESDPIVVCIGTTTLATTPVISGTLIPATTTVSGTSAAGAVVFLYKKSGTTYVQYDTTTANGSGNWTMTGVTLNVCDTVVAKATQISICSSAYSTAKIVSGSATAAPVITGTYCLGVNVVNGTSASGAGTQIQVFENGIAEGNLAIVATNGTWQASTGISIGTGSTITAKATAPCYTQSVASGDVIVSSLTSDAQLAFGGNAVIAGDNSVSGTGTNGNTISVYIDGVLIGTTVVNASNTWTLSGLAASGLYESGVLSATATASGLCPGTTLTGPAVQCVSPASNLVFTASNDSVCYNSNLTVTINSSVPQVNYRLYIQGSPTGNAVSGNGGTINLVSGNLTVSGTVRVLATRNSLPLCEKYLNDSIAITIINLAAPIISISGIPPFCEGKTMTLQSSYTSNIVWSTGAVTSAISVIASGNYTVTYTDNLGCTSSTVKVVSMIPNPVQPIISAPSPVGFCYGNNIVLTTASIAGLQYQWRKFGNNIPGATATNYTLTTPGKYRIRVTDNNGCTAISNFYEVVAGPDKPLISANTSLAICPGGMVVLSTSPLAGLTYIWRNYANSIAGATTNQYSASAGGSYTCVATNSYGCTHASDPLVVSVSPSKPVLNYTGTVGICAGGSLLLAVAPQPLVEYQWKKYSNLIAGANDPSYTVNAVGSYRCIASDGNGCTRVSDAVNVIINCKVDISFAGGNFVNIYPNPSSRSFTVSSNLPITEIKIFDMKGIKVNATLTELENGAYEISGLSGGIYTAIIDTGESSSIKRLVVMKNN